MKKVKLGRFPDWVYKAAVYNSKTNNISDIIREFESIEKKFVYKIICNNYINFNTIELKIFSDNKDASNKLSNLFGYILTGMRDPISGIRHQHGTNKWYETIDDSFIFEIITGTKIPSDETTWSDILICDLMYYNLDDENNFEAIFNVQDIRKDPSNMCDRSFLDIIDLSKE